MLRPYDPDPDETVDLGQDFDGDGRPVGTPAPAMSEGTVRKLASLEYQFVRLDADLYDLRDVLRQVAREAPRCAVAAKQLQTLRRMLRRILAALDEDVTAAVAALERMAEEPPF